MLRFIEKPDWTEDLKFVDTGTGKTIWIKSFSNGKLEISPLCGNTISDAAQIAISLLRDDSNITDGLGLAFNLDPNEDVATVVFDFNGVSIAANKGTTEEEVVKQLYDGYAKEKTKRDTEYEEYKKTPQYAIDMAEKKRKAEERQRLTDEVKHIDETTEMEFKDDEAKANWDAFVEVNSKDGYSAGVVNFARLWAKYMQYKLSNGEKLVDIADSASNAADIGGITGFMYGCAVNSLSQMWKHGEELRKWHNGKYNHDGDGCVNPAVLTLG